MDVIRQGGGAGGTGGQQMQAMRHGARHAAATGVVIVAVDRVIVTAQGRELLEVRWRKRHRRCCIALARLQIVEVFLYGGGLWCFAHVRPCCCVLLHKYLNLLYFL